VTASSKKQSTLDNSVWHKFASFFDAFSDTDEARKIIRETIYFWKNHLELAPTPSWNFAEDRAMIAALYSGNRSQAAILFRLWLEKILTTNMPFCDLV
jgi:hypothetical protein